MAALSICLGWDGVDLDLILIDLALDIPGFCVPGSENHGSPSVDTCARR